MSLSPKNIELEYRARFSKKKYEKLQKFLSQCAQDLGPDNKRVWFFVLPDKQLKVTHNISRKNGKITLKLNKIGQKNHSREIEFPISEESIKSAIQILAHLGYKYLVEPTILRHNYLYKNVELALKYSKTWGYHLELEIMLASLKQKTIASQKIFDLAQELQVKIMSKKEQKEFTEHIEKTYQNPIL